MAISTQQLIETLKPKHIQLSESANQQTIQQIDFDSRQIKDGSAFFCLTGEKVDGHDYLKQASEKGAICFVCDQTKKLEIEQIISDTKAFSEKSFIYVEHVREALAKAANLFYDYPSRSISLIGVTGTNGKTTTTHLIAQILSCRPKNKVGLIGTLGSKIFDNGNCKEFLGEGSGRTTPEATELQAQLKKMIDYDCSQITMEVSSHSLDQKRVYGSNFKTAVFTNLTQDHLDYHLTMNNYFQAKALLFEAASEWAIINRDSEWSEQFMNKVNSKAKIITYGIESDSCSLRAENIKFHSSGIEADLRSEWGNGKLIIPLNGLFNLYNALAALAVGLSEGLNWNDCLNALQKSNGAPGRFQVIQKPFEKLPTCIVDYAHTPDGLENVLKTAKDIVPAGGKLICVFGCGGDRDTTKRPIMGKLSAQYADLSIITSDNPRSEEPNQIIADILSGIPSLNSVEVEIDRANAIEKAIRRADSMDIVLIAGKGHEDYQIFADRTIHFDDVEEVKKVYEAIGGEGS